MELVTPPPAVVPQGNVPMIPSYGEGAIRGEFTSADIRLPRLQIVQGSGELSKKYNQGTLLYMDEVLFDAVSPTQPPAVLKFIPIALRKQFRENVDPKQDPDARPRIVDTMEQVKQLGGWTEWIGGVKPPFSPSAQISMLIEKPAKSQHGGFNIELDGRLFAPAIYFASGAGYRALAHPVFNAAAYLLRENGKLVLSKRYWRMSVVRQPAGAFTVFVPDAKVTGEETSPAIRELCGRFIHADLGGE